MKLNEVSLVHLQGLLVDHFVVTVTMFKVKVAMMETMIITMVVQINAQLRMVTYAYIILILTLLMYA